MKPEFKPGDKVMFIGPENSFTCLYGFTKMKIYTVERMLANDTTVRLRGKRVEFSSKRFILVEEVTL